MTDIRIGNAPVSYGVYGDQAGGAGASPTGLLDSLAETGYPGSELGPPGFFGTPAETAAAFAERGLTAVGAYAPVHFTHDDDTVDHDLARIETSCRELAETAERTGAEPGLVIIADEGSPALLEHPARDPDDRTHDLDAAARARLHRGAERTARLVERHGLRTTFHPHVSTYVESPWEVDLLLEHTSLGLTLDTGHTRLAGGDPVACFHRWRDRINHLHVKDVSLDVLARAKAEHRTDFDVWWAAVCVPFGRGDVDLDPFLDAVCAARYRGWLVVEQDREPTPASQYPAVVAEQAANLARLTEALARRAGGDPS